MLCVVDAVEGRSAEDTASSALIAADRIQRQNARILGVLLNRVRTTRPAGMSHSCESACSADSINNACLPCLQPLLPVSEGQL